MNGEKHDQRLTQQRSQWLTKLDAFIRDVYPSVYEGYFELEGQGPDLDEYITWSYPELQDEIWEAFYIWRKDHKED